MVGRERGQNGSPPRSDRAGIPEQISPGDDQTGYFDQISPEEVRSMAGCKKGRDGLTDRQRAYSRHRAEGKSQIEAYTLAGYSDQQSTKSKRENACHLEQLEAVRENIERLQALADAGAVMNTEQRKCALYEIYQDSTNSTRDRLKALDLLNRMEGDYIDRREINATVQGLTRSDRIEAMQETLESLKKTWEA